MVEKKKNAEDEKNKKERREESAQRSSSSMDDCLKLTKVIDNVVEDIGRQFNLMILKLEALRIQKLRGNNQCLIKNPLWYPYRQEQ